MKSISNKSNWKQFNHFHLGYDHLASFILLNLSFAKPQISKLGSWLCAKNLSNFRSSNFFEFLSIEHVLCFSFFFFRFVYNPCKFIQFFLEIILPKNIIYTFFGRLIHFFLSIIIIECKKHWKRSRSYILARPSKIGLKNIWIIVIDRWVATGKETAAKT